MGKTDPYREGTYALYLDTGARIVFTGKLRFRRTDDGFIEDYDAVTDDLVVHPIISHVVAIARES